MNIKFKSFAWNQTELAKSYAEVSTGLNVFMHKEPEV